MTLVEIVEILFPCNPEAEHNISELYKDIYSLIFASHKNRLKSL